MTRAAQQSIERVAQFIRNWQQVELSERERDIISFALKVNTDWRNVRGEDVERLRRHGITDRGVVQIVHAVNNFTAYNKFNVSLGLSPGQYDYEPLWASAFARR